MEDKNQKMRGVEQQLFREKNEVLQKENQLSFLLKSKEDENEKSKYFFKRKNEIDI
jgi:hypothetical protein